MTERVVVIANPASGRGRGAKALPAIRSAFAAVGVTDVRTTTAKGDERAATLRAIDDGATTIVAAGGDGTWSNVANGILAARADCRLALLAAGTGNDFAKTVGAPATDVTATARLAVGGPDVRCDVGRIEDRYFLNVSGFGFDIAVLEDIERIAWLKGDAVYLYSALRQLVGYHGVDIDLRTNGASGGLVRHLMLIVANARNFGGAFRIAPSASVRDGKLDAIAIHDASPLRRIKLFGAATKGTHIALPEVVSTQAPSFGVRFPAPPAYETDGEYHRARSAELEIVCVPGALRVVTSAEGAAAA